MQIFNTVFPLACIVLSPIGMEKVLELAIFSAFVIAMPVLGLLVLNFLVVRFFYKGHFFAIFTFSFMLMLIEVMVLGKLGAIGYYFNDIIFDGVSWI